MHVKITEIAGGTGEFSSLGSLLRLTLGKDLVRVRSLLKVMSRTHGHEGPLDSGRNVPVGDDRPPRGMARVEFDSRRRLD